MRTGPILGDDRAGRPERDGSGIRASWRDWAAGFLLAVGLSQMAGDVLEIPVLKGIGAASVAAPLPKVFSDVAGLETFASGFELEADTSRGVVRRPITPELYARLSGPYNRRNVYGAALAYAPRLPAEIWEPVFCFGLAPQGPLRRELGVPADATAIRIHLATRTRGRSDRWTLEPDCAW